MIILKKVYLYKLIQQVKETEYFIVIFNPIINCTKNVLNI
jgi:hypothetical protein